MARAETSRVREAMQAVRRRDFLPEQERDLADIDSPLPIGYEQTNSQPTTVANMLTLLDVQPGQRVLDVGAGSGWTTALLGWLVGPSGHVLGLEIEPELARWGAGNLAAYDMGWTSLETADPDVLGRPEEGPYDRILVSAAATTLPESLADQLADGGLMVVPVAGEMLTVELSTDRRRTVRRHGPYSFVPLR